MTSDEPESSGDDERVHRLLRDLAAFGADAAYTVGLGLTAYLDDGPHGRVLRNNGRHVVIQVATVVEKLPDIYKKQHPDVDWIAIGRMRNLIAHHDARVDDQLVFTALARRVPDLVRSLGLGQDPDAPPG